MPIVPFSAANLRLFRVSGTDQMKNLGMLSVHNPYALKQGQKQTQAQALMGDGQSPKEQAYGEVLVGAPLMGY